MSPHFPSDYILENHAPKLEMVDPEHSAIGEQYGVRRGWVAPELGEEDVLSLCDDAWARVGTIVSEAHRYTERYSEPPPEHGHKPEHCNVLLEMDVNPDLPTKWGWVG